MYILLSSLEVPLLSFFVLLLFESVLFDDTVLLLMILDIC